MENTSFMRVEEVAQELGIPQSRCALQHLVRGRQGPHFFPIASGDVFSFSIAFAARSCYTFGVCAKRRKRSFVSEGL